MCYVVGKDNCQSPVAPSLCKQQRKTWWDHDRPIAFAGWPGSARRGSQSPARPARGVAASTPQPLAIQPTKKRALPTTGRQADIAYLWESPDVLHGCGLLPSHPSPAEIKGRVSERLPHVYSINLKFGQDQWCLTPVNNSTNICQNPWAQPCLRDDLKGGACADILWGCSFHTRDCLLASGPCSAPGTTCATLWVSPQPNQPGKYTVARGPLAKLKPNQENRQAGSSCSAAKGWETPKQWSHGWVCSPFPLHCLGKTGLLMGQGNPSPGHIDDISHGSATPGGHSGLAQA